MYYFALKAGDAFGNLAPMSNVTGGSTLGVPGISRHAIRFHSSVLAGQPVSDTLEVTNTGQGVLDFSLMAVPLTRSPVPCRRPHWKPPRE